MARTPTRTDNDRRVRLIPGLGHLDKRSHETIRADNAFVELENARMDDLTLSRRKGKKRVTIIADPTAANGSWTLGTDHTTYAKASAATQLLIPAGGFALHASFTMVRPSSGTTSILSTPVTAGTLGGPFSIEMKADGATRWVWRKSSDSSEVAITSATHAEGTKMNGLFVFDPENGTTRLYMLGDEEGTAVTGIAATEKPIQTSVAYYWGTQGTTPTAATVTSGSGFTGRLDNLSLRSLQGTRVADGDPTLLSSLRRINWQELTNPGGAGVRFYYDFNETTGATIYDWSRFKNHMAITGSASSTTANSHQAENGNLVFTLQAGAGKLTNVIIKGGDLFYEVIKEAEA